MLSSVSPPAFTVAAWHHRSDRDSELHGRVHHRGPRQACPGVRGGPARQETGPASRKV